MAEEQLPDEIKSYIDNVRNDDSSDRPEIMLDMLYPEIKTGYERIEGAFALIHENVPVVNKDMQSKLYDEEFPEGEEPRLDYIDLATDEYIQDPNQSDEEIISELKERGLVNKDNSVNMSVDVSLKDVVRNEKEIRRKGIELGWNSGIASEGRQGRELYTQLNRVFPTKMLESDEFKEFKKSIQANIDKPLLIIHGHGGNHWRFKGILPRHYWSIGERNGELSTGLDKVIARMMSDKNGDIDKNKYSAVVLVSCNTGKLKPPKIEGSNTPIYYAEGTATIGGKGHEDKVTKKI